MKRASFSVLVLSLGLLFLAGCGIEERTVEPPLEPLDLLEEAWTEYDNLNLDVALAKFDTVLNYLPTNPEAYIGKGMTLGLLQKYGQAHGFLNLAVFAEGQSGDLFAPGYAFTEWILDTAVVGGETFFRFDIQIREENRPLVFPVEGKGIQITIDTTIQQSDTVIDTIIKPYELTLDYFSDSTVIYRTSETTDLDTILVSFYFLRPGISYESDFPILSYSANGAAYLAEEKFEDAYRNARVATLLKDEFSFSHYPYFDHKGIFLIQAYSAFRLELFTNTVEILTFLDPDWTAPEDPSLPDSYRDILNELEKLKKLYGLPL